MKLKFIESLQYFCHYCDVFVKVAKRMWFSWSFFSQLTLKYHFTKRDIFKPCLSNCWKSVICCPDKTRIEQISNACVPCVKKVVNPQIHSLDTQLIIWKVCLSGNCAFFKKSDVKLKYYIKYCQRFSIICQISVAIGSACVQYKSRKRGGQLLF